MNGLLLNYVECCQKVAIYDNCSGEFCFYKNNICWGIFRGIISWFKVVETVIVNRFSSHIKLLSLLWKLFLVSWKLKWLAKLVSTYMKTSVVSLLYLGKVMGTGPLILTWNDATGNFYSIFHPSLQWWSQ